MTSVTIRLSGANALQLYTANKNYSSWSLRPWLMMSTLDIPFEEVLVPFGGQTAPHAFQRIDGLWQKGLHAYGGPFLAGDQFSAVDAFYAPLAR